MPQYRGPRMLAFPHLHEASPAFLAAFTATRAYQEGVEDGSPAADMGLEVHQMRIPAHYRPPEGYLYAARVSIASRVMLGTVRGQDVNGRKNWPMPARIRLPVHDVVGYRLLGNDLRFRRQLPRPGEEPTAVMDVVGHSDPTRNHMLQLELTEQQIFPDEGGRPALEVVHLDDLPECSTIDPAAMITEGLAYLRYTDGRL